MTHKKVTLAKVTAKNDPPESTRSFRIVMIEKPTSSLELSSIVVHISKKIIYSHTPEGKIIRA